MNKGRHGPAMAFALLVTVCACAAVPDDESVVVRSVQSSVQGGQPQPALSPAVAICVGASPSTCEFRCTGTLIAPNLVLSVRHCIQSARRDVVCATDTFQGTPPPPGSFWVTTNSVVSPSSRGWHRVSHYFISPTLRAICGGDISLLMLSDNVSPADAVLATPVLDRPTTDASFSRRIVAIGYGASAGLANDVGSRRIREQIPVQCLPGDNSLPCPEIAAGTIVEQEFVVSDGVCEGDSGSAALDQEHWSKGELLQYGVLSRAHVAENQCDLGVYEQLGPWGSFIAGHAREAALIGGYPTPAWTSIVSTATTTLSSTYPNGALGGNCSDNADCETTGLCASPDNGVHWVCSQPCAKGCPSGFACSTDGTEALCFPTPPVQSSSSGSCCVAAATSANPTAWLFVLPGAMTLLRRRSRRSHCSQSGRRPRVLERVVG